MIKKLKLNIPTNSEDSTGIELDVEKNLFIFLGINGSGKSALISQLANQANEQDIPFEIIRGYRPIEIENEVVAPTIQLTESNRAYFKQRNLDVDSRYKDPVGRAATGDILWSLISKDNKFKEEFLSLHRKGGDVKTLGSSPFEEINKLFFSCGIKIKIELDDFGGIVNNRNGNKYVIRSLSDGERALLLLASQVITAAERSCIFVDEPERHLHPSVTSKLLSKLLELRPDCKFFIATHDSSILSAFSQLGEEASIFVVHHLIWKDGRPFFWDIKELESATIPEDLANLLLGEPLPIIFCEGSSRSYDVRLYSILFPSMQCVSAHNSSRVIANVRAIKDLKSGGIRTPKVWGILDRDWGQRQKRCHDDFPDEIVHIGVHEIESAFFVPHLLDEVINHQVLGDDVLQKVRDCFSSIFSKKDTRERLVKDYWRSQFGHISLSAYADDFVSGDGRTGYFHIPWNILRTKEQIEAEYDNFVRDVDIFRFASIFTVKNTSFMHEFATKLGLDSFDRYVDISLDIVSKNSKLKDEMIEKLELVRLLS